MRVIFRADASLDIGTGHVMRCLTLADALAADGADCEFICRAHPGNLIGFIRGKGYPVHELPVMAQLKGATEDVLGSDGGQLAHRGWLGASQAEDAQACAPILAERHPNWLIVDHYSLDARWERALAGSYRKLMVIDDLADRRHACDVLLDQTLGRAPEDYHAWAPPDCQFLCGSQYALLRPEFAALRPFSLRRRATHTCRHLLVNLGGIDRDNVTESVLEALRPCGLPHDYRITVVIGATSPWLESVRHKAECMPWPTTVLCGVSNMAHLMADSDLAIGAAGATAWERCCLGLPTIMLVLAENQRRVADVLSRYGAGCVVGSETGHNDDLAGLVVSLSEDPSRMQEMSKAASHVTRGEGTSVVAQLIGC